MDNDARRECRYHLLRLLRDGGALIRTQPWASEADRWGELVFAVLCEVSDRPQTALRGLTADLVALGLVGADALAADRQGAEGRLNRQHLLAELTRAGLDEAAANQAAGGLHELAQGLTRHFDGRLQRYLRHYGELMLAELGQWFAFRNLTEAQAANAITYWLQNAVLMPLSNIDAPVRSLCEEIGASPADLVAAADELDINLSLLDDLALIHRQSRDPELVQRYLGATATPESPT